jgi:hypothetical protein
MPDRAREKSHVLVDLNNFRQILAATSMYQTDNQDSMPHPTWGTVNGANSGPDGWAYAVKNNGKITNAPNYIPNCQGRDTNSVQYATQLLFFKIGQLGPFLPNVSVMYCPKDVEQWSSGPFRTWFLNRNQKITSYCMNGTVGGYCGSKLNLIPAGRTFKSVDFKAADIVYWEQNETAGFYFADASNNPETLGEIMTQRHGGPGPFYAAGSNVGGGVIGRISGSAEFMRLDQFMGIHSPTNPPPNDLLNGPGFRR